MRDLAAVMVTVDRSPGRNYLVETLRNLKRSDLITSERLYSFDLVDSGPGSEWARSAAEWVMPGWFSVVAEQTGTKRTANENVAAALRQGHSRSFAAWVVFLEDDIDVCDRFFDSVGAWLDDCSRDDRRVYALGSCQVSKKSRGRAADIGIEHFFGTQAFALRRDDALNLSAYLDEHVYDRTDTGAQYDLLMHDWALARWPSVRHFLASVPSFVQHIGRESVIEPRPSTHLFASWPGREWSYVG